MQMIDLLPATMFMLLLILHSFEDKRGRFGL